MLRRTLFTLRHAHRLHGDLCRFTADPTFHAADLCALEPTWLQEQRVAHLILDFDGVLAAHGAACPTPASCAWLSRCCTVFGPDHVWIYSNQPTAQRKRWMAETFPGIRWIGDTAGSKKPYPDALCAWKQTHGISGSRAALVDDRLLTGILCALLTGIQPVWITHPLIDPKTHPWTERWISGLRHLERRWLTR